MGELEDYISRRLEEMLEARYKVEGWWCPRCDVPAFPLGEDEPGWCMFCGMDPKVEGPKSPQAELRGIVRQL